MDRPPADIHIDRELVQNLLAAQAPDLAHLPLGESVEGWDSVFFRLGPSLAVRFPRRELVVPYFEAELAWLPQLGPFRSVSVPVVRQIGVAGDDFPWPWVIAEWVEGEPLVSSLGSFRADDGVDVMAAFFRELHLPAPPDAPHNPFRGRSMEGKHDLLATRLEDWDAIAARLPGFLSPQEILEWFDQLCAAPAWSGDALWIHGDLHAGNVLALDGHIRAVIDWVDITSGDPSADLAIAWNLFERDQRRRLRDALPYDDATWQRAQAWALYFAPIYATGGEWVEPIAAPLWRRLLEDRPA